MIKLAANAFLMTRISFINEIANVCEATGADVVKVAEGVGLDHRLGPHFLRAGIGYGGSCFPKDSLALKQLASNSGYHFQLLSAVIEVNELQKRRVIGKLEKHLGHCGGRSRCSASRSSRTPTTCARRRRSSSRAGCSPKAPRCAAGIRSPTGRSLPPGVEIARSVAEAVRGADAAVIVTEWPELQAASRAKSPRGDGESADHRRAQPARSGGGPRGRLRLRGIGRPTSPTDVLPETPEREGTRADAVGRMEAIILAGGKAERLGDAAGGRPKSLVDVAGEAARRLPGRAARERGRGPRDHLVRRRPGRGVRAELAGLGPEIVAAEEPERLGRGGGIKFAARGNDRRRAMSTS